MADSRKVNFANAKSSPFVIPRTGVKPWRMIRIQLGQLSALGYDFVNNLLRFSCPWVIVEAATWMQGQSPNSSVNTQKIKRILNQRELNSMFNVQVFGFQEMAINTGIFFDKSYENPAFPTVQIKRSLNESATEGNNPDISLGNYLHLPILNPSELFDQPNGQTGSLNQQTTVKNDFWNQLENMEFGDASALKSFFWSENFGLQFTGGGIGQTYIDPTETEITVFYLPKELPLVLSAV